MDVSQLKRPHANERGAHLFSTPPPHVLVEGTGESFHEGASWPLSHLKLRRLVRTATTERAQCEMRTQWSTLQIQAVWFCSLLMGDLEWRRLMQ